MLAVLVLVVFGSRGWSGYRIESILSGSMAPALPVGGLALIRQVPPSEYRVGDVISFQLPTRPGHIVTHRLKRLFKNEENIVMAETQGDANPTRDQWVVSLGSIRGKEVLVLPWLGYLVAMTHTLSGFLVMASISFFLGVVPSVMALISLRREKAA
jgi:signal peptidase